MKKLLLVVATMLASNVGFSQAHTDSSLNTMTKMQLANVYLDQVVELAFNSPYTPFTIGVNDTIHGELDIPVSRYIKNKRETVMEMSKNYGETMKEELYEIIPYSDKKDMIRAILFLQEMNYNIKKK
jgi:hypothetical protein